MNFQQFIDEFKQLKLRYPRFPNHSIRNENADWGDYLVSCKNAYFSFDTSYSRDIIYLFDSYKAVDSCDGDYVIESEKCYQCIDVYKVYNSTYLNYCARMYDSHFCWDCGDSNNLFGCTHLKFKKYCIFNKQYSPEEYEKQVKELLKKPAEENLKSLHKLTQNYPVTTTNVTHCENCDFGNHIHYSKNLYLCFDAARSEDASYLYDAAHVKNSYDLTQCFYCDFCYECVDSAHLNNCSYLKDCEYLADSMYCETCSNSNHLFGCVSLDKQEYCILNKKYSKEEYEKKLKELVDSIKEV